MIRPAKPADIPEVRAMLREYIAWIELDLAFQEIETEIANLPGDYQPPGGVLLVAEDGHQLIGMVALRQFEGSIGEMKRLFVRAHARGHGLATELVHHVIDEARHRNYAEIRLDTLPMMTSAQSLYEALGFDDIEPYYQTPIAGTRFMALRL